MVLGTRTIIGGFPFTGERRYTLPTAFKGPPYSLLLFICRRKGPPEALSTLPFSLDVEREDLHRLPLTDEYRRGKVGRERVQTLHSRERKEKERKRQRHSDSHMSVYRLVSIQVY